MPEKAARSFQNKPNLPNRLTRGQYSVSRNRKTCRFQRSMFQCEIRFILPPNHTIHVPATNLQATKLIGRKITIYDGKQKHGVGVMVACHSMISDLAKI